MGGPLDTTSIDLSHFSVVSTTPLQTQQTLTIARLDSKQPVDQDLKAAVPSVFLVSVQRLRLFFKTKLVNRTNQKIHATHRSNATSLTTS